MATESRRVTIVQEYIPNYRVPFFEGLIEFFSNSHIDLRILAGTPHGEQKQRGDASLPDFVSDLTQRERTVLGKRIVTSDAFKKSRSSELIIFEQARRNIALYQGLLSRRVCGYKIGLWGHGRDFAKSSDGLETRLLEQLTRRSDWFYGYTRESVEHVVSNGFPRKKTTVVENAIDTVRLRSDILIARSRNRGAHEFKTNPPVFQLLFLGALHASKHIDFLLESIDQVNSRFPQIAVNFVGDGPELDKVELFCASRSWATATGYSDGEQKAELLARANLILNPGRVGLIALDSLAAGVPMITTDFDLHAPEFSYLTPGETTIVTRSDVKSYSQGIIDLAQNAGELARLARNCSALSDRFSIENMVENFARGILSALDSDQSSATRWGRTRPDS